MFLFLFFPLSSLNLPCMFSCNISIQGLGLKQTTDGFAFAAKQVRHICAITLLHVGDHVHPTQLKKYQTGTREQCECKNFITLLGGRGWGGRRTIIHEPNYFTEKHMYLPLNIYSIQCKTTVCSNNTKNLISRAIIHLAREQCSVPLEHAEPADQM